MNYELHVELLTRKFIVVMVFTSRKIWRRENAKCENGVEIFTQREGGAEDAEKPK
jgi:hypothetical protein